ncbi:MAG: hypothetical protein A3E88_05365 [Legionellales bacterium RIFCSPHIGHO2_12_FULL_35_11]|nr:MAG: hypothetical protein A3E88_05365 [Legionellales bacterium RIFCSPHIGHO2_12_FULL_35_11]
MDLTGLSILNTRPKDQAKETSMAIKNANGTAYELPAIQVTPTDTSWIKSLPNLNDFQQIIFISQNAAKYFFKELINNKITLPSSIFITAIGQNTEKMITNFGYKVSYIPNIATSEGLLELSNMHNIQQQNILLIKGIGGRVTIQKKLNLRGANLKIIEVYSRSLPDINREYVDSLWHDNKVDIILFTSFEAIKNIFYIFGENAKNWLVNKPCIVISDRLQDKAVSLGIKDVTVSDYRNIMNTLEGFLK